MKKFQEMGWIVATIVAVLALSAAPVLADDHEEGEEDSKPYRMVHFDYLNPAKMNAFVDQQKAWVAAFDKAEAGEDWSWWVFQSGFDFVTGWAFKDFAELDQDGEKMMAEVVGAETLKKLQEPTGAVVKHHNMIVKHAPEISYMPEDFDGSNPGEFFSMSTYWIRPGSEKEFMEMAKKIKGAFEKTKQPHGYNIWMVNAGQGSFIVTGWGESAGEYYSRPEMGKILGEAYGEEGSKKIFDGWLKVAVAQEHKDYRFRADLSYRPGAEKKDASK